MMKVRSAVLWSVTGQWLVFAFNFTISVFLARHLLPPSAFGTFSVGFAAAGMISTLQDFGLNRFVIRADNLTDKILDTCTTVTGLVGATICTVIVSLSWPVAWYYGDQQIVPIMLLIGGAFLFLPFNTVPIALLQRTLNFRALSIINLTAAATNGAVSLCFALAGFGPLSLALGFVMQQLARAAMAQRLGPRKLRLRPAFVGVRPIISFGSGTTLLAVSGAIGTRSPDLIIGSALGMRAVGLFGRAAGMVDGLRVLLNGGLSSVFYSHFAQLIRTKSPLDKPYLHLVACYTSVMWPAMLILSLVSGQLVPMIYGPGWAKASEALVWVAMSEIIFFALPLHTDIPVLSGNLQLLLVRNFLDTAAAVLSLLCLAHFGLTAAAAARLVYAMIWVFLYFGLLRRIVGFNSFELFVVYAKSAFCTIAACVSIIWLRLADNVLTPRTVVPMIAISGGLWLVSLALLRHPAWQEMCRGAGEVYDVIVRNFNLMRRKTISSDDLSSHSALWRFWQSRPLQ